MSKAKKKSSAKRRTKASRRAVSKIDQALTNTGAANETHPWRLCPAGEHWVRIHSRKTPKGKTEVTGHCRTNPSNKDQIYSLELTEIAKKYFENVDALPASDNLGFRQGNDFDRLIAGWTEYWNEVLKPQDPLDPNLVKALIATESSFNSKAVALASNKNWARGLTQITDQTLKILSDEKGEVKNHLINIDQKDAYDSNLNIAAGIRWLFHKKHLLEHRTGLKTSWENAVMEYKSYTKDIAAKKPQALKKQAEFVEFYRRLKVKK